MDIDSGRPSAPAFSAAAQVKFICSKARAVQFLVKTIKKERLCATVLLHKKEPLRVPKSHSPCFLS
jgi:hypothetical protein